MDMNVGKHLRDTDYGGKNIIQGSLSLDDEIGDGCTVLFPGFHKHIEMWWDLVYARRQKEDVERFGGSSTGEVTSAQCTILQQSAVTVSYRVTRCLLNSGLIPIRSDDNTITQQTGRPRVVSHECMSIRT